MNNDIEEASMNINKFIARKLLCVACTTFLVASIVACGDENSSSPETSTETVTSSSSLAPIEDIVSSSSVKDAPESSAAEQVPGSSETVSDVLSSSSEVASSDVGTFSFVTTPGNPDLVPDEDGFYDMGNVYQIVPKTSKIAFVIRHSKRQKSTGTESTLTPIGIQMAQTLGAKLVGDESFYYASTDFVRTRETCRNIALGRGETDVEVETWDGINGGYFLTVPSDTLDALVAKKGGNPRYIAQYSYGVPYTNKYVAERIGSYFYDFFERGNQFLSEVIVPNMPNWKRVSILVSHDMLVEPLIVFVSNRSINLKVYEKPYRWVNYLSGIAVIVDEAGLVTVLPVRGDEVGWMIPSEEIDETVAE